MLVLKKETVCYFNFSIAVSVCGVFDVIASPFHVNILEKIFHLCDCHSRIRWKMFSNRWKCCLFLIFVLIYNSHCQLNQITIGKENHSLKYMFGKKEFDPLRLSGRCSRLC